MNESAPQGNVYDDCECTRCVAARAVSQGEPRCPDCSGAEFPGWKRGVRCATCNGTATAAPQAAPPVAPKDRATVPVDMLLKALAALEGMHLHTRNNHQINGLNWCADRSIQELRSVLSGAGVDVAVLPLPAVVQAAPGDVHPAAPQTTVPTASPFSEPRALGQGELPVRALYDELLFSVGNKYPGETRHQTALRYIRQAEAAPSEPSRAALTSLLATSGENGNG